MNIIITDVYCDVSLGAGLGRAGVPNWHFALQAYDDDDGDERILYLGLKGRTTHFLISA